MTIFLRCLLTAASLGIHRQESAFTPINPKSDPTPQLDGVLRAPEVVQLCALLESGLIPLGTASDFGEDERKAACERRLCWWTLQGPKSPARPTNITTAVCEMFCGLPGYGVSLKKKFMFHFLTH